MKTILFCLLALCVSFIAYSQNHSYNFDNAVTGSHTDGESLTFLPSPNQQGGTARVRVGSQGGGFQIIDDYSTFSNSKALEGTAPTGGSVNKFSVYGYSESALFKITFKVRFSGNPAETEKPGTWYFFAGNGVNYSNNSSFNGDQAFSGLRFSYQPQGGIVTSRRNGKLWTDIAAITAQDTNYDIEIYGNNSNDNASYIKNGKKILEPGKWDLWINGNLTENGGFEKSKSTNDNELAVNSAVNSFMFYGENSAGNAAKIYLDDIAYIFPEPLPETLPVRVSNFSAKQGNQQVQLNWKAVLPEGNQKFELQHSADGEIFVQIADIIAENHLTDFSYTHYNPVSGVNYYRLVHQDINGTSRIIETANVNLLINKQELNVYADESAINIRLKAEKSERLKAEVYNISGKKITEHTTFLTEGENHVKIAAEWLSGFYFVKVNVGNETYTTKIIR